MLPEPNRLSRSSATPRETRWTMAALAIAGSLLLVGAASHSEILAERRARIENMKDDEKEKLLRKQQRFAQLDPAEQQRLRTFAAALDQDPDATELRAVLERYNQWLNRLQGLQRAELLQLEPAKRIERVRQMQADDARHSARRLSPADQQVVVNWIEQRVVENMQEPARGHFKELPPQERHRQLVHMIWQRSQAAEPGKWPPLAKHSDIEELRNVLSEPAREQLTRAATTGSGQGQQLLADWIRQSMGMYFSPGRHGGSGGQGSGGQGSSGQGSGQWKGVSEERLQQFFEKELPAAEREQLLALPADELERQLRRLYYTRMMGSGGQPFQRGDGSGFRPGRRGGPFPNGERPGQPPGDKSPGNGPPGNGRLGDGPPPKKDKDRQPPPGQL